MKGCAEKKATTAGRRGHMKQSQPVFFSYLLLSILIACPFLALFFMFSRFQAHFFFQNPAAAVRECLPYVKPSIKISSQSGSPGPEVPRTVMEQGIAEPFARI